MTRRSIAVLGASLVLLQWETACSRRSAEASVDQAVVEFHARFNAEQLHEMYTNLDDSARKAQNERAFTEALQSIRAKFGKVTSSARTMYMDRVTFPGGVMATTVYATNFERGMAKEHYLWRFSFRGEPLVITYQFEPAPSK
jgi:hypothetical protein